MKRRSLLAMLAAAPMLASRAVAAPAAAETAMTTQRFEFVSDGKRLSGFIDVPPGGAARATIMIIPGYGRTDVAGQTSYYDLRSRFTRLGITTVIWDKPGCGQSEGTFDADQPVASSAREVLDAARYLRDNVVPGSGKIGFWGISRAGWIVPLAMTQDPGLAFWISVSGTDGEENFPYLLNANLRIEGRSEPEIRSLVGQWRRGFDIMSRGGTFETYLAATAALRKDPFMVYLTGGAEEDKVAFLRQQQKFLSGEFKVDKATSLQIYIPDFPAMLARLNVPVLAIFGEKDRNVDWRKTSALYARTIGKNPKARLIVRTFPDGNHNLQSCQTGGLREMLEMKDRRAVDGYYEGMDDWLRKDVLG